MTTAAASVPSRERQLIAPLWHTLGLLLMMAVPIGRGIMQQHGASGPQVFASHSQVFLRFYVPVLVLEWLGVAYVWWGIRINGVSLRELIGGRWSSAWDFLRDLFLGIVFLLAGMAAIGIMQHVLGPTHAKGIGIVLPQTPVEYVFWILISLTAGFVEELLYRGYLQTQFTRLGLPMALSIVLQAVVFGAGHSWEGFQRAASITVFALIAGAMAAWRRSLRPNMIGHAAMDILAAVVKPGGLN